MFSFKLKKHTIVTACRGQDAALNTNWAFYGFATSAAMKTMTCSKFEPALGDGEVNTQSSSKYIYEALLKDPRRICILG